jgi:hypothetical protein
MMAKLHFARAPACAMRLMKKSLALSLSVYTQIEWSLCAVTMTEYCPALNFTTQGCQVERFKNLEQLQYFIVLHISAEVQFFNLKGKIVLEYIIWSV